MGKNRPSLSKHSPFTSSHQNNSVLLHDDAAEHGKQPHKTPFRSKAGPWGDGSAQQWGIPKENYLFLKQRFCSSGAILAPWQKQLGTFKNLFEKLPPGRSEMFILTVGCHLYSHTFIPQLRKKKKKQIWNKMVICLILLARERSSSAFPLLPMHKRSSCVSLSLCDFFILVIRWLSFPDLYRVLTYRERAVKGIPNDT